jgi:hypothetical protein
MTTDNKKPPEAVGNNPFELFDSKWFRDATEQLCIDGWPIFIVQVNIGIQQARKAYSALKAECERLKDEMMNSGKFAQDQENKIADMKFELEAADKIYRMNRTYIDFIRSRIINVGFVTERDIIDHMNEVKNESK